jgi:glycosyltransferase involved in cell wall biosynthesis
MNDRPKVSILMPCYNAERYVGAALESALNQTWPNKEIVVVDDGSKDSSAHVLQQFASRDVKVIHQKNQGQCAAANRAFAESTGDYIKFFDADDLLAPETLERQMQRLGGSITAVASAEWGRFYGDDLSTFRLNPEPVWKDMDARDWLVQAWEHAHPMQQCALWLLPRPLMEQTGLWNEELSLINDFEFFARILCHASEVRFTPGARLFYRSGLAGSLSGQKSRKAVESSFKSITLGTEHLLRRRQDAAAKRSCANILQQFVYEFYPAHPDLCSVVSARIKELGGSNLKPTGSPRFHQLSRWIGWKGARRVQRAFTRR